MKVSDTTLAYLAGLVDGEAYIGIKRSKAYRCQGRTTPSYHARIQVRMVHEGAIKTLAEAFGGWHYKEKRPIPNRRQLFCYQASDLCAETILRALLPFLVVKKESAETVLALRDLQLESNRHRTKIVGYRNFPNARGTARQVPNLALSDEYVSRCDSLYEQCKALNH